ncbi:thiol-disulfide oxidoreductase DCC family protein [Marinactinospora rubrisoli]|uniref:Thiol-disulfide oxidoreductase DCC family protein n=1 Tax=Marinactinospora rubrisoli TaxID=2715399 RepID=A0ABW2KG51_9ACTN
MPTRPTLLYDGDCGFCTRSVRVALRLPVAVTPLPWQAADLAALGVDAARARGQVLFIEPSGRVHGGAMAVAALLRRSRGLWPVAGAVLALPVVRTVAAAVYRTVSANRHRLPGATPACRLPREQWPAPRE